MPFVHIIVFAPQLGGEQIRQLEKATTDLMTVIMRKPIEGTAVFVEHIDSAGWTVAGAAVGRAAHVEATIGRGTNTANEKARFISEMTKLLRCALGAELPNETYVVLHELDHDAYGRGGITRAERDPRRDAASR